ncbi:MAG: gliding motility-associated C-terminal domain-containing protein [Chitinophagaceae bacterium]|nr:gliding motility-associated C-terminal domain-containing protein [Chitinophagaceae bacterium]
MKIIYPKIYSLLLALFFLVPALTKAQPCTNLGQTPSTAFPVCGTSAFQQNTVPICATNDLFVPGCSGTGGALYQNKNPYFYKFTCFTAGTLGFKITPNGVDEDYDWQLYDITGHNPDDIFTNNNLIVTGNWSGSYGPTGTAVNGAVSIQCASTPSDNVTTFAAMPNLIQGHEYLLMVSHFTDSQTGYGLTFSGGTAVITDTKIPAMLSAKADCDGQTLTVKLNKKLKCNSLTNTGSEFSLLPANANVISALTTTCSAGFDFDEVVLHLATPLTNGNYQLVMNLGTDANSLLDICNSPIAPGSSVPFNYTIPLPILADSIGKLGCSPDSIKIYFPKGIQCRTIAPNGSDFSVAGPTTVNVVSAGGNCINGNTDYIVVKFAAPIFTQGTYQLTLKAGIDGGTVTDECGIDLPIQTLPFNTYDTVNAEFSERTSFGCLSDTIIFSHDGAHNVNFWNWTFNNGSPITTQSHTVVFTSNSTNNIQLIVGNGVCRDTATKVVTLDNEVKAAFSMPAILCPEDKLEVLNQSQGQIDLYRWNYDVFGSTAVKDPPPFTLPPTNNRERYLTVKLVVTNINLGCSDSARHTLRILDNCYIGVPTAFTPNGDGLNDFFQPHNAIKADNYKFQVFNRWGQMVFSTTDWQEKWDGKLLGRYQTTGVYVWMLSYTHRETKKQVFEKGTVTLIR